MPVWEIEPDIHERSVWVEWALLCEGAEIKAQNERQRQAERRNRAKR